MTQENPKRFFSAPITLFLLNILNNKSTNQFLSLSSPSVSSLHDAGAVTSLRLTAGCEVSGFQPTGPFYLCNTDRITAQNTPRISGCPGF